MDLLSITGQYILPFAVPFVIAILALAFPIMTDASSKISDQYGSSILAKAFQKEFAYRGFKWMLYASLVAIVIYILKIPVIKTKKYLSAQCITTIRIATTVTVQKANDRSRLFRHRGPE